jgi:hypothetical protein
MLDERRKMRRLRQDLERVRLLCELIRKREQRKRDLVTATMNIKYLELNPFAYFLRKVMELLQEQDTQDIFGEPVDPAEVPDYLGEFFYCCEYRLASISASVLSIFPKRGLNYCTLLYSRLVVLYRTY